MNLTDCRKLMFETYADDLNTLDFKPNKKNGWFGFKKNTTDGVINILLGVSSYADIHYCGFSFALTSNVVENLFRTVNKVYTLDEAYEYSYRSTFGSGLIIEDRTSIFLETGRVSNEFEMKTFLNNTRKLIFDVTIPQYEIFLSDLRFIDIIINSDVFWEDDFQKFYNFGAQVNFIFRRIIIAHLCNNKRCKIFFEHGRKTFLSYKEGNPEGSLLFLNALNYLEVILKAVKPIY